MSQLKMNVFRRRNTFVTVGLCARFNRLLPSFIPLVAHLKHVQTQREIMCSGLAPSVAPHCSDDCLFSNTPLS